MTRGTTFCAACSTARCPSCWHDAKAAVRALLQRGMDPKGIVFDTAIAAYLLDPTQSGYDLPRLALAYCNAELPELDLDDPAAVSLLGGSGGHREGRGAACRCAARHLRRGG